MIKKIVFLAAQKGSAGANFECQVGFFGPKDEVYIKTYNVWSFFLSYKLRVFAWLVIYQGLPTKSCLAKSGFMDDQCLVCGKTKSLKHALWELVSQRLLEADSETYFIFFYVPGEYPLVSCVVWGL